MTVVVCLNVMPCGMVDRHLHSDEWATSIVKVEIAATSKH
jgi:hypothetical protein